MRLLAMTMSVLAYAAPSPQLRRFPLLGPLTGVKTECRASDTSTALRAQGIVHMVTLKGGDEPARMFSVSTDDSHHVRAISAYYSVAAGRSRREGESLSAFYWGTGALRFGTRRYYTVGTPARRDEDQKGALSQVEGDSALVLAKAVLRHCAR